MSPQETLLNGRYRLDAQQGSGGMAVIYRATDLALGRPVAVKVLRPSLTNDADFLRRFRQEARNVANLSHPNIVTVHDVGQDGNTHYIVMEYIDGDDLKKLIRSEAPFALDRALSLAIKICAGVGYAHRAGLVHADVKPQNVLIIPGNNTFNVKVTDFGIAQAASATQPRERQRVVWGSPHYFAPEQAQGDPPTPASDVYSIGIVLFEMITGRLPFVGTDQQALALAHIHETSPNASEINPNVPESMDRILQKVLSKEPTARYRTAEQFGRILVTYRRQGQVTTDQVPFVEEADLGLDTEETLPPPVDQSPVYGPKSSTAQSTAATSSQPTVPPIIQAPIPRVESPGRPYSAYPSSYHSPATQPGVQPVYANSEHKPVVRAPDAMI